MYVGRGGYSLRCEEWKVWGGVGTEGSAMMSEARFWRPPSFELSLFCANPRDSINFSRNLHTKAQR